MHTSVLPADFKSGLVCLQVQDLILQLERGPSSHNMLVGALVGKGSQGESEGRLETQVEGDGWVDRLIGLIGHLQAGNPCLKLLLPLMMVILRVHPVGHQSTHLLQLSW